MEINDILKAGHAWHCNVAPRSVDLLDTALAVAVDAHAGQVRKYTGEPYVTHPVAVARLVGDVFPDVDMIGAAYLHDVLEDTDATAADLLNHGLGSSMVRLVQELTDVSKPEDGNRATRKALDRAHTAAASDRAKTVKLADLLDNTRSIMVHDPNFAVVYMREKALLLDVLTEGNRELFVRALSTVYLWEACK